MLKRTTIEIDEVLLARAKRALGIRTTRATVEASLRLAADHADRDRIDIAERQDRYLRSLATRADIDVLASDRMWR